MRALASAGAMDSDPLTVRGAGPWAGRRVGSEGEDDVHVRHSLLIAVTNASGRGSSGPGVVVLVVVLIVVVVIVVVIEVVEIIEVVEVVVVIIVIVIVAVEDDQRRGDVVGVEEGVVVGVESRRQLLGGSVEGGIVVTAGGGRRLVVTFQGSDQRSKSGARIRVHGWTVPCQGAEWTARAGDGRRTRNPSCDGLRATAVLPPVTCDRTQPRSVPLPSPDQPLEARVVIVRDPRAVPDLPVEAGRRPEDYEYQIITVPPRSSVSAVRATLTDEAEYGRWELARTRKYIGGGRKVWMRRRIIRVHSTLYAEEH